MYILNRYEIGLRYASVRAPSMYPLCVSADPKRLARRAVDLATEVRSKIDPRDVLPSEDYECITSTHTISWQVAKIECL